MVSRAEAGVRIRAAVDAASEAGGEILILARTDALDTHGLEEALWRAQDFAAAGADMIFVEGPRSEPEMEAVCAATSLPNLANMVEGGVSPVTKKGRGKSGAGKQMDPSHRTFNSKKNIRIF